METKMKKVLIETLRRAKGAAAGVDIDPFNFGSICDGANFNKQAGRLLAEVCEDLNVDQESAFRYAPYFAHAALQYWMCRICYGDNWEEAGATFRETLEYYLKGKEEE